MRARLVCLASVAAACALTALGAGAGTRVTLSVTPRNVLIDQPVSITVSGLKPGSTVKLTATTRSKSWHLWRSTASFRAGASGTLVVSRSPSLGGTYRGLDAMGLFWSMRLVGSKVPLDQQALFPAALSTVHLVASAGGRSLASASLTRRTGQPAGHKTTLAREGIVGCYYAPSHKETRRPGILFLGGSEGGLPCGLTPSLLAVHGYPTLALGYFGLPGLPRTFDRVPLEYFRRALEWLGKQPGVDSHRLVVLGISRGGETGLLLGSVYRSLIHAVAEYVGGPVILSGQYGPSFTLRGRPIPTGYTIPVAKIDGPTFLIGAGQDMVTVSSGSVENIVAELRAHHRHDYTALVYPAAGHGVGVMVPNLPFGNVFLRYGVPHFLGGTLAADSAARSDSWPKLLAFLGRLREA